MSTLIIDLVKSKIKDAMRAGRETERDILKLVLSETQRLNNSDDETTIKIISKLIEANKETLSCGHNIKLVRENEVLKQFIPEAASANELRHHLSEIERELSSKNGGAKIGCAIKYLKSKNVVFLTKDLQDILGK